MGFINSIANNSNFAFFLRIFYEFFSGFRAKFQKIVTCVAFSIKFAKTNQKFAENSEFCENYSLLSLHPTVPCFRKKGQHFQNKQSRNIRNVITLGSSVLTKQTTRTNHSGVRLLSWVEHLLKNNQSFAHSTARSCSAAGGTSIGNFAIFGFSFFSSAFPDR